MDAPRVALLVIDAFVAVTAVGGGLTMATKLARLPPQWLESTPFRSYLIPGLLLAFVVGGSATVATVATLLDSDAGAAASLIAGAIMMGWIAGELRLLKQQSWLEALYFAAGLAMALLGATVWLGA